MRRFTHEHEWIEIRDGLAVVGISEHAAHELGEITFVELPDVGAQLGQGDPLGVVESVKAAADVYSPVSGVVAEVNRALEEKPEIISHSAERQGWLCKLKNFRADDLEPLMTEDEYAAYTTH